MIVYISGPMTGRPDHNYPAFNAAELAIEAAGHTAINPARHADGVERSWLDWMRLAIPALVQADAVALLPGWETSPGARIEYDIARSLGFHVAPLDVWIGGWAT